MADWKASLLGKGLKVMQESLESGHVVSVGKCVLYTGFAKWMPATGCDLYSSIYGTWVSVTLFIP